RQHSVAHQPEANGGQEDSGDFFATYGTKKERRTVRKEAQVDDSAERNEEGEQGQKRSDSQEASVLRLDAQGRNEEGQQSLQRSGAKDAAAKSLAGAKNAQEAAKNRKEKSERKKARQARKEKANEAERKKDKKQRAKGSERAQSRERDSQNSQVPPPLPPKPSPKKKQNARLDAIERQLPELQNLLRTLQQDKSSSHGSESSASNVQPPEPARDAYRTQSTATEPKNLFHRNICLSFVSQLKSRKTEKVPISEVDIPAPLDDPQVNQPKKEKREPVIETVDKSVSRLVELEPDFRWMFGDKTVGLMVKPPCRDVAINIFIEEAKPAQRLDGMALDSGNRVQNSMLQSQSSFSQSAQQTNSTTVSSMTQSQSVEHNSSTAMSSMTQSRHQFGQQQLQLLELLKTNASAF
uniref:DIS3-like exonuclease 2 n=1 Tax=Macrostomum lignano TaxID=282301 RepID=A0A1I8HH77_9PLAT